MNAEHLQLIGAALSGGLLQWLGKPVWRWIGRNSRQEATREQQIAVLRKALDKAGIRQNAAVSICDLLITALELVDELPPAAERVKEQERHKLADVVRTLERISGGDE